MRKRLGPARLFQQFVALFLLLSTEMAVAQDSLDIDLPQSTSTPEWVSRGSYQDGNTHVLVVQSTQQPCTTPVAADLALEPAILEAVKNHLIPIVGETSAKDLVLDSDTINQKLLVSGRRIVRQCEQDLSAELAERYGQEEAVFYRGYAQIRIDQSFVDEVIQQSAESRMRYRLKTAGLCGVGLLAILAVLFGYLRVNHATRGLYNRRLQSLSIVIVIVIISIIYFAFVSLV